MTISGGKISRRERICHGLTFAARALVVVAGKDYLYCACNHMTDFSSMAVPSSFEEMEAELISVNFNTFTLDDIADTFATFEPTENSAILIVLGVLLGLDLFTLLWAHFKLHRRLLKYAREQRNQRHERWHGVNAEEERRKQLMSAEQRQVSGVTISRGVLWRWHAPAWG